jgi:hypothetical protein
MPLVKRRVTVVLSEGGQGFRDETTTAWALMEVDDPVWLSNARLVDIAMTRGELATAAENPEH